MRREDAQGLASRKRCKWCNIKNPRYLAYHDLEWGKRRFDDAYLFEMLLLESFQAGLSWECILNKREAFRRSFDGFDPKKIGEYGEEKIKLLLADPGIVRNRLKIMAAVQNSRVFCDIVRKFGSFYEYLKEFSKEEILFEIGKSSNEFSDAVSRDLVKRGMRFVGTKVVYAYLQAIGMICSHERDCFLFSMPQ